MNINKRIISMPSYSNKQCFALARLIGLAQRSQMKGQAEPAQRALMKWAFEKKADHSTQLKLSKSLLKALSGNFSLAMRLVSKILSTSTQPLSIKKHLDKMEPQLVFQLILRLGQATHYCPSDLKPTPEPIKSMKATHTARPQPEIQSLEARYQRCNQEYLRLKSDIKRGHPIFPKRVAFHINLHRELAHSLREQVQTSPGLTEKLQAPTKVVERHLRKLTTTLQTLGDLGSTVDNNVSIRF